MIIEFVCFSSMISIPVRKTGLFDRLLADVQSFSNCVVSAEELPYDEFFLTDDENVYDEKTGEWTFSVDALGQSIFASRSG